MMKTRIADELKNLSFAGLLLLAIATGLATFAGVSPFFDYFSHFRAIYLGFALIAAVVLLAQRRRAAWLALAVVAVNGAYTAPWIHGEQADADVQNCEPMASALALNVRGPIGDHDAVIEMLRRDPPDVLFVSELREGLKDRIVEIYPHRVWRPKPYAHWGLFTKYPITGGRYLEGPNGRPTIEAVVSTPNGPLRILGAHPSSPGSFESTENRNAMLRQMAAVAGSSEEPVLLLGDLNVTMFSPNYLPLEDAGLVNARRGRGVMGTWPNFSPLRIPIDHVLTSDDLTVCDLEVGDDFGSDHLPVRAAFRWNEPKPLRLAAVR